jgi:hypothetical protein
MEVSTPHQQQSFDIYDADTGLKTKCFDVTHRNIATFLSQTDPRGEAVS